MHTVDPCKENARARGGGQDGVGRERYREAQNNGNSEWSGEVGRRGRSLETATTSEREWGTHISMCSNSSRFLCRLRNAAARFLTSRASRLLSPVTSGGTKSFVLTRSPERAFFVQAPALIVTEGRLAGTTTLPAEAPESDEPSAAGNVCCPAADVRGRFCGVTWGDDAGVDAGLLICADIVPGTKSKTWWVGRHWSEGTSGVMRPLRTFRVSGIAPGMCEEGGEVGMGSENGS